MPSPEDAEFGGLKFWPFWIVSPEGDTVYDRWDAFVKCQQDPDKDEPRRWVVRIECGMEMIDFVVPSSVF